MSTSKVKRLLPCLALVLVLLAPLAQLLRTQNPWDCFNLTSDESYFAQAIYNWENGRGYRMYFEDKAFSPATTVGLPMAWGTELVQKLTGESVAEAGRIWVHSCFYALLLLLACVSFRRSKSWAAPVLTLGILAFGLAAVPQGPYVTYGLLGEIPGALVACLALFALDLGNERGVYRELTALSMALAGVLAVFAYFVKPTYAFLVPSIAASALYCFRRRGLWTAAAAAVSLAVLLACMAHFRGETIPAYISEYTKAASSIALLKAGTLLDYYRGAGKITAVFSLLILAHGIRGALNRRKTMPSEISAFLFFASAIVMYACVHWKPVDKQWLVFYFTALAIFSVRIGTEYGPKLSAWFPAWFPPAWFPNETLKPVLLASILIWLLNVPTVVRRSFLRAPVNDCPIKEQRYVDDRLHAMSEMGDIRPQDVGVLLDSPFPALFLYELGWSPEYRYAWKDLKKPFPKWVVGEKRALYPIPAACQAEWMGSQYGMVRCD